MLAKQGPPERGPPTHLLRKLHALEAGQAVVLAHGVAARRALQQLEPHHATHRAAAGAAPADSLSMWGGMLLSGGDSVGGDWWPFHSWERLPCPTRAPPGASATVPRA